MSAAKSLKMLTDVDIRGVAQHSAKLLTLPDRHSLLARHLRKINLHIVREFVLVHTCLAEQHLYQYDREIIQQTYRDAPEPRVAASTKADDLTALTDMIR